MISRRTIVKSSDFTWSIDPRTGHLMAYYVIEWSDGLCETVEAEVVTQRRRVVKQERAGDDRI